jgi:hypothetical protein
MTELENRNVAPAEKSTRAHKIEQAEIYVKEWAKFFTRLMKKKKQKLYLVTFIFDPLNGSERTRLEQMRKALDRLYGRLICRIARNPRTSRRKAIMVACPDYPVPHNDKKKKSTRRGVVVNDGLHLHAIFALSRDNWLGMGLQKYVTKHEKIVRPRWQMACSVTTAICFLFYAPAIYLCHIRNTVAEIKTLSDPAGTDALIAKRGGTSILAIIIVGVGFFVLVTLVG